MKPLLSNKAVSFRRNISPVREIMNYASPAYFKRLGLDPASIISFVGGWVNHEAPKDLQKAYKEIVEDRELFHKSGGYSPTLGMAQCREAIANYEKHLYEIQSLQANQVAIGASSTQLTTDLMKVLLDPNDKILLLDPSYCNFPTQIMMALDVEIIRFPVVNKDTWEYVANDKVEEFKQFILTEKPKVVLLVSPDNPTSQIPSDSFVEAALNAVRAIGSFLIIDFAYKDLVFNQNPPKYYSWSPDENYLSIHSNSKWSRSLGRRLGWIEASEEVVEALESIQSSSILCPDTLHQMALTRYLNEAINNNSLKPYITKVSEQYHKAAQQTVASIQKHLGLPCFIPQGGLYTCIKVGMDGAECVEKVLKKTGVLFVPGWGFGRTLQDAVRISFGPLVNDLHLIDEGIRRAGELLRKKNEKDIHH